MLIIGISLFPKSGYTVFFKEKMDIFSILIVHAKLLMFIQDVKL